MADTQSIMALDVGEKRIGVAIADPIAKIASPHRTISNNEHVFDQLRELIADQHVGTVVVGLPRGLEGQETAQTQTIRDFNEKLQQELNLKTVFQDEAVTSVIAEEKLKELGKPYAKEDIDMYAAAQILEDYLHSSVVKELA